MKLTSLVLTLALVSAALLAGPAVATAPSGLDAGSFDVLQMMGLQTPMWMIPSQQLRPRPSPHPDFPLNCPDFNAGSCTFVWNGGCCCVGSSPIPNTYCGNICV